MTDPKEELLNAWIDAEKAYQDDVSDYVVTSWASAPPDRKPKVIQAGDFARWDEMRARIDELREAYQASWRG